MRRAHGSSRSARAMRLSRIGIGILLALIELCYIYSLYANFRSRFESVLPFRVSRYGWGSVDAIEQRTHRSEPSRKPPDCPELGGALRIEKPHGLH